MIRFILADLRRLWIGAVLVTLLVALATALGITVTLQERALRLGSARAAAAFDLVVGAPGSETQLVLSAVFLQPAPLPLLSGAALAALAADPRVAFAAPVGFGDYFGESPVIGTTTDLATQGGRRPLGEGRVFTSLDEAIIGADAPFKIGDGIHPMHGRAEEGGRSHDGVSYRVVGRMAPTGTPWDRAILVPIEAVWAVHGLGGAGHTDAGATAHADESRAVADAYGRRHVDLSAPVRPLADLAGDLPGVPAVVVKPKTIADAYRLRAQYRGETSLAVFPAEVLTRLYATLGDARFVFATVAGGAQLLVGACLALVAAVHVSQRRRQIGALRALGAPRLAVFGIVWCELLAIVTAGIAGGMAIGYAGAWLISAVLEARGGIALPVEFAAEDGGMVITLVLVASVIAAVPALVAYRQPIVAALRS